jgi:hypothetical protein
LELREYLKSLGLKVASKAKKDELLAIVTERATKASFGNVPHKKQKTATETLTKPVEIEEEEEEEETLLHKNSKHAKDSTDEESVSQSSPKVASSQKGSSSSSQQHPLNQNEDQSKPLCMYGAKCYRTKNVAHTKEFRHL